MGIGWIALGEAFAAPRVPSAFAFVSRVIGLPVVAFLGAYVRLPESLEEAVNHLEKSDVLREAMGDVLFNAFVAVRRGEVAAFADKTPEEVVEAHRWRY